MLAQRPRSFRGGEKAAYCSDFLTDFQRLRVEPQTAIRGLSLPIQQQAHTLLQIVAEFRAIAVVNHLDPALRVQ